MKWIQLCPVICLVSFAAGSSAAGSSDLPTKPLTITMKSLSYEPRELVVHVGDSVLWTNAAHTAHTATSDDEGAMFDTGDIEPGKSSKALRLEKEGEFKYHCRIHGKSMSGTIVVAGP